MSPIMIRPVKEQIEHDRVIRALDHLFRDKYYAVDANVGDEKKASYKSGVQTHYPDLVLTAPTAPKKILAVIEVESGESVNKMEAMAEWSHFSRLRAPFQLYVPAASVDMARRLIEDHQLSVTELWSYVSVGDEIHFHLVRHASKSYADTVQPGETMPAMPVYIPPPPPPPPVAPVVEKAPKAEKNEKAEKPEKAGKVKVVDVRTEKTPMPAAAPTPKVAAAAKPAPAVKAAPAAEKATKSAAKTPAPAAKAAKAAPKAVKAAPKAAKVAAKPVAKAATKKVAKPAAKAARPAKKAPARARAAAKAAKPAPKAASRAQKHK